MTDIMPVDLEQLATKIRHGIYSSYRAVLIGNAPEVTEAQFERMKNPVVGDLVTEGSTIYRSRGATDLDAVGILEEITREPVEFGDPEVVWDEQEEGRPHPTEPVFYIRTLDGRRCRWVNANFIAAGELARI